MRTRTVHLRLHDIFPRATVWSTAGIFGGLFVAGLAAAGHHLVLEYVDGDRLCLEASSSGSWALVTRGGRTWLCYNTDARTSRQSSSFSLSCLGGLI